MRIVILRPNTSDFGKIGTYNVQEVGLAKAFANSGHDVSVLFTHRKVNKITKDETYDFVYYLPHLTIGLHGLFRMSDIRKFNPELLIMFADNQLWAKNVINWCKKNGVRCVNYFGGVLSNNPGWLHQTYTKLILMRNKNTYSNSINIAKTQGVKDEMERNGIICDKVISIGLDDDLLHENKAIDYQMRGKLSYEKNDKIILFVGRLVDYKRPFFACELLKKLREVDKSYKLLIIGKGQLEKELMNFIHEHNLEDSINFIGRVNYDEIYKYMIISDCLINLSDIEIFGMSIIEGMYYGLSVVAHTAPGPNDVIKSGDNGYLINSYDIDEWTQILEEAITNRVKISEKAICSIEEKYIWSSIYDEFIR